MADDPCQSERENYNNAIVAALAAVGAGALAAPETLGASFLVGLLLGGAGGFAIATAHNQLARCLRANGLTAQADVLEDVGTKLEQELAAMQTEAGSAVA